MRDQWSRALLVGGINGVLIAYVGVPPFVVIGHAVEPTVTAASVIGGANLSGGAGAFGAAVGRALIEVTRISLILRGFSTCWQGTLVGTFIVGVVLVDRFPARISD